MRSLRTLFTSVLLLLSLSCMAQEESEDTPKYSFGDYLFFPTPWENPFKNWPVRVSTLSFNGYRPNYEIDIINEFGHHLIVKSNSSNQFSFKSAIQFFRIFDFWFNYRKESIQLQQSSSFQISNDQFNFSDHQFGLGTNFNFIRIEIGMGKLKSVTFLQTDTSFFYTLPFEANYISYNLQVLIPTKLGFQIVGQFNGKTVLKDEAENLIIENGAGREFLIGLVVPVLGIQLIPYYSFSDENYKFTHKFFGLENEMSNKISYQRLGLNFTIPF